MAKLEEYVTELLRLKKDQLVDIIIGRKVPEVVNLSEKLRDYISNGFSQHFQGSVEDSSSSCDDNLQNVGSNMVVESKLKLANLEIKYLKEACDRLEKVIEDKERIITLLDSNLNYDNENHNITHQEVSSGVADVKKISDALVKRKMPNTKKEKNVKTVSEKPEAASNEENKAPPSVISESPNEDEVNGKWSDVVRKKRTNRERNMKKVCFGTKATGQDVTIQGAIRRQWIYVGRIAGKQVSEHEIKNYLKEVPGNELIIVKKLNTLGQNSAFSIGLPSEESRKLVYDSSFWPEGIILRDFTFDKQFFLKNRELKDAS